MKDAPENQKPDIVVIDDDEAARLSIAQMLKLRGYRVEAFSSAEATLAWPGLHEADAIVTDVKMPGMDGEELLAEVVRRGIPAPVIMITGHGDVSMAVRCLRAGAYNFVEKPFEDDVLLATVERAAEKSALLREGNELRRRLKILASEEDGRFGMVGRSREMLDLFEQIEVAAPSDAPVIISGETGSGKELVARAMHSQGPRARGPFVPVNAGALPENMLESELFGHARGAFTGADSERQGKLVAASGGTLLLDEVECLPAKAQVELLRVLDDGLVYPLGVDKPKKTDIRLVVTTKSHLQDLVRKSLMREDFYHRIAVLTLEVPPLRERAEDIPQLISFFLKRAAEQSGIPVPTVPQSTLSDMLHYSWPGNVRELKHAIERMVITSFNGVVGPFKEYDSSSSGRLLSMPSSPGKLQEALERTEKWVIESTLRECQGVINDTCATLGISRRALYERMRKYGLDKGQYRD